MSSSSFVVSFTFLDPCFHGRGEGGEPEWPPSPLRAFQALVAASAARHRGSALPADLVAAFEWLERLCETHPPRIVAPVAFLGSPYSASVPNNALDIVGRAWSRGNYSMNGDAKPATHRAMKTIRPLHLEGTETVHFVWDLPATPRADELGHVESLVGVAHHLVAFGWGVDLVVAKGAVLEHAAVEALTGEHWTPRPMRARGWRVPMAGTLAALEARHRAFLKRIQGESWTPPPPLTCFRRIGYRRPTETAERAWAAFALRRPLNPDRYSSFDPVTETTCVAARLRHAAHVGARASKAGEWSESRIASFVVGHAEGEGDAHIPVGKRRFAYLPLPTLVTTRDGGERVGEIRRAILTTFADDCDDEVGWAKRSLSGSELVDERSGEIVAALETIEDDAVVSRYSPPRGEASWASVTPVVLPGHDDPDGYRRRIRKGVSAEEQKKMLARIDDRIESLLRKAIEQAGFSEEMARYADLDWRRVGYWRGADHVSRYRLPKHLERLPRFHVRILWRDAHGRPLHVRGPVCLGGGRFYGFGLCATLRERDVAPELSRTPTLGNKPSHTGDTLASERSGQE